MADWKKDLSKHSSYAGGGGTVKKCACGRDINRPGTDICGVCYSKQKNGTGSPTTVFHSSTVQASSLPIEYLAGGYFIEKNGKSYIKEEVFIKWAIEVSTALKQQLLTPAAIRRYFSKLRAIEYKYKADRDFELAREGIFAFSRDVHYTENRGVTPPLFTQFIEANAKEAKKDAQHFRAFVEHFQSVVAYFKER